MQIKKLFAVCMATVLLCGMLSSCRSDADNVTDGLLTETAPAPISPDNQKDYTDDPETLGMIAAYRATFSDMAESAAEDFETVDNADGVTVTAYRGSAKQVRVPARINEKAVTEIAAAAFADNVTMMSLYLPDSVLRIGVGILSKSTPLVALRTPSLGSSADQAQFLGYLFGAATYADNAIHIPASLKYLELGGKMTALADYALFDCVHLVCLTLPDTVKHIGSYAMYRCTGLVAVNTSEIVTLADHAMTSCSSLTFLEFGSGLTSVGIGAFEGCMGLRRMILPFVGGSATENTYLGYIFGAEVPDFSEGYYPPYLVEVTLLSGCVALGNYAFFECTSLTNVTLPDGLTTVGVRAFSGCSRLEGIALPDSVTTVRESAFYGCRNLGRLEFGEQSTLTAFGINAFQSCSALTSVKLPALLSLLPASAFADCTALQTLDLGGVVSVGKNAFHNCNALTSVTAASKVEFEKGNDAAKDLLS